MNKETYTERLKSKSLPNLKKIAKQTFQAWIRQRDEGLPCVSCGKPNGNENAGHFYPSTHSATCFDEDNVHGQCVRCNMYLSGNLNKYRLNLLERIGEDKVNALDWKHSQRCKRDKFDYIEIILKYFY